MSLLLSPALAEVARVLEHGNVKPGRGAFNWRHRKIRRSDMIDGALRHILQSENGIDLDESGQSHLAHAIARLLIQRDAELCGMSIDTRILPKRKKRRRR